MSYIHICVYVYMYTYVLWVGNIYYEWDSYESYITQCAPEKQNK